MSEDIKHLPAPLSETTDKPIRLWPLWLLLLILLLAVTALGFFANHQWQLNQQLEQAIQQQAQHEHTDPSGQSERLNDLNGQLERLANQQTQQDQQLDEQALQLSHVASSLLEAGHRDRSDWLLAEAEYLMRLANQRLQTEHDINGALTILESADQVLRETDDPGSFPVREQLAREILALQAVQPVDQTGLYLQLEALVEQVGHLTENHLSLHTPLTPAPEPTDSAATDADISTAVDTAWSRLKDSLKEVVVIRRMDEPLKPLLSPEQSAYARLNLQLMLEQAEMALLRGNQTLYQRSLEKVEQTLATWYDASQPQALAMRNSLRILAQRNIRPEIPDISRSLSLLKGRLSGRHQPKAATSAPTEEPSQ